MPRDYGPHANFYGLGGELIRENLDSSVASLHRNDMDGFESDSKKATGSRFAGGCLIAGNDALAARLTPAGTQPQSTKATPQKLCVSF